ELGDLAEWLDGVHPFIARKGVLVPDNPFLAVDIPGAGGAPVDIDNRLADMRHEGPGPSSIHVTQLAVTAAMMNRGTNTDEIVAKVLAATKDAAGKAGARWNWHQEERAIGPGPDPGRGGHAGLQQAQGRQELAAARPVHLGRSGPRRARRPAAGA